MSGSAAAQGGGVLSAPSSPVQPLVIHVHESNGHLAYDVNANGKRKPQDEDRDAPLRVTGCLHLPRDSDGRLQRHLHSKIRSTRELMKKNWLADKDNELSLRHERVVCMSCDFTGLRENADDHAHCFMTHAILTNHHFALLPRKKQLFCARCLDFVYPDALLALTQLAATPSASSSNGASATSLASQRRHRAPALRRRLMRSSARRGLVNMGNTCYMNAVLQALAHNPLLQHEYFVLRSHNTTICEQTRRQEQQKQQLAETTTNPSTAIVPAVAPCTGCEMSSLLQTLFPAPRATLTARHLTSPVVPQAFLEAFWAHDKSFVGANQHDAHEFLVALLNGVHTHTFPRGALHQHSNNTLPSPSQQPIRSPRVTATGQSLCDCVVHQNFAGAFGSEVSCLFCDNVSTTYDAFLDISLSLDEPTPPRKAAGSDTDKDAKEKEKEKEKDQAEQNSLGSLLRVFTAEERLKGVNQVYCRRCSRYVDATKQLVLHKLPNLLVLHLKRLDFHKQKKIADAVAFPLQGLDLAEFCSSHDTPATAEVLTRPTPTATTPRTPKTNNSGSRKGASAVARAVGTCSPMTPPAGCARARDAMYDLAAVICHHGDAVDGGHFTAFVHASQTTTTTTSQEDPAAQWLHFDDCSVTPVAAQQVEQCQAYMLFYVRRRLFV